MLIIFKEIIKSVHDIFYNLLPNVDSASFVFATIMYM